jgi:hypothetical protein
MLKTLKQNNSLIKILKINKHSQTYNKIIYCKNNKILHSKKLGQIYNAGTYKPVTMKHVIE